ncbi:MAG: hypothetical protein HOG95_04615 [Rhodospirillaceae bacterium]|nr:hypothetical protein [Rhodospirillaceae bacterium]
MSSKPRAKLSHSAIFCKDVPEMLDFYTKVLGLIITDEGVHPTNGIHYTFLSSDPIEHHEIVLVPGRPEKDDFSVTQQISFYVDTLEDVQVIKSRAETAQATEIRPRCHGNAWSVYFLDPEGNKIEVYTHTPWYVPQPYSDALDLDKPSDQIRQETEATCRANTGFMTAEDRSAELRARKA